MFILYLRWWNICLIFPFTQKARQRHINCGTIDEKPSAVKGFVCGAPCGFEGNCRAKGGLPLRLSAHGRHLIEPKSLKRRRTQNTKTNQWVPDKNYVSLGGCQKPKCMITKGFPFVSHCKNLFVSHKAPGQSFGCFCLLASGRNCLPQLNKPHRNAQEAEAAVSSVFVVLINYSPWEEERDGGGTIVSLIVPCVTPLEDDNDGTTPRSPDYPSILECCVQTSAFFWGVRGWLCGNYPLKSQSDPGLLSLIPFTLIVTKEKNRLTSLS